MNESDTLENNTDNINLVPETNLQQNNSLQLVPEPQPSQSVINDYYPLPNEVEPILSDEIIENNNPLLYNNNEYQLLYDNSINNPFYESLINQLNYDTDNEENEFIRIIYSWKFEINYDYFDFKNINIFISKNNKFKNKINEIKQFRSSSNINSCISGYEKTGDIIKIKNSINILKKSMVYPYFIIYYDNTKVNIIFYGLFNQKIDEEKLISNIIYENKFGKKGIVTNNYLFNLGNYDFIVFYKKIIVE